MSVPRIETPMRFPILVGILGGGLDVAVGLILLSSARMASTSGGMVSAGGYAGGVLVLTLGGAVLSTAVYLAVAPMRPNRRFFGSLMLVYGGLMFVQAGAMLAGLFPLMQGAGLSAAAMVAAGSAMLISGATMGKP